MPGDLPGAQKPAEFQPGSISGRVEYAGSGNPAGITVTLEKTDGQLSLAVIAAAENLARGIEPNSGNRSIGAAPAPQVNQLTSQRYFQ